LGTKVIVFLVILPHNMINEVKYKLEEAIEDQKLELLYPSREYSEGEIVYLKGYIEGLTAALEEISDFDPFKFPLNYN
jgi:hypothetical protein